VDAPGQKWLYQLYQYIKQKETATILYQAFGKAAKSRIISPQLLKEYKGRWYLLSFDHQQKDSRLYALDRIKDIKPSLASYTPLEKEDAERYFDHVVGVTVWKDRKIEKVTFEVYGIMINYFKTKPIHTSQILLSEDSDKATYEISVIVNHELVSELISHHSNLHVLTPVHLRETVIEIISRLRDKYGRG